MFVYKVTAPACLSVFPEGVTLPDNRKNVDPRKLLKLEARHVNCSGKNIVHQAIPFLRHTLFPVIPSLCF